MKDRVECALVEENTKMQRSKTSLGLTGWPQSFTPDQNTASIKVKLFVDNKTLCQKMSTTNQ